MKFIIALAILSSSFSAFAAPTFECGGTEPFWNANISNNYITYSDIMVDKKVSLKITSRKEAHGYSEGAAFIVKTKYAQAAVAIGSCNDGMSDETYSHTILFENDGRLLGGCCNRIEK